MLATRFDRRSAGVLMLLAILSGCGGATTSATPSLASASILPDKNAKGGGGKGGSGGFIFTVQLYGNDATVYSRNGLSLNYQESIQGLSSPQGTRATNQGWWYIANGTAQNVLVYRAKKNKDPKYSTTLNDYGEYPVNVDLTPSRQVVAVSNLESVSSGAGSVSVYLNRQTQPSRKLVYTGSGTVYGYGIAVDHQGNCYWSFNKSITSGNGGIVEFAGCSGSGTLIVGGIGNAGGMAFDQKGDLFYVDRSNQSINICPKGTGKKCSIVVQATSSEPIQPVNINFDVRDKYLWVADESGYVDAVDTKTDTIVVRDQAVDGSSNPPFGVAPEPGA